MAVLATKIISVESITISIPIGTKLNIADLPNILYVNYNGAPFHGYITFDETEKRKLLVLNPHTNATPTSGTTVAGVPVPLDVASNGTITNIPTDIQQEVLLKGGLKNAVVSNSGGSQGTIINYEPLSFYISILVGGIDWRPASKFPSDIDFLDHVDGYMKEPVTSADIPAIDAYQYLISLQTRSQAEDYQLESLKQSLAKKMILARDINYLMACVIAIERAYFDLIEQLKRLDRRVTYIEGTWLPNIESRLFTTELNIKSIWDNLIQNWRSTHQGLEAARDDAYWRVYAALRHYGSDRNGSTAWSEIPLWPGCSGGSSNDEYEVISTSSSCQYSRTLIDPTTGGEKSTLVKQKNPDVDQPSQCYYNNVYGLMRFSGSVNAHVYHTHTWGSTYNGRTSSGDNHIRLEECFHNIVIKSSNGSKGGIITADQIGLYNNISEANVKNKYDGIVKIRGDGSEANIYLNNGSGHIEGTTTETFFGGRGAAGFSAFASGSGDQTSAMINGERIYLSNLSKNDYINFSNGKACSYGIMNWRGNAYIANTKDAFIIERKFNKGIGGLAITENGMHLFGLSEKTLEEIKKYVTGEGCGQCTPEVAGDVCPTCGSIVPHEEGVETATLSEVSTFNVLNDSPIQYSEKIQTMMNQHPDCGCTKV